eukprot:802650-Amphidinium_carterae.1
MWQQRWQILELPMGASAMQPKSALPLAQQDANHDLRIFEASSLGAGHPGALAWKRFLAEIERKMHPHEKAGGGLNRLGEVDIRRGSTPLCRVLTSGALEGVASSTLRAMTRDR